MQKKGLDILPVYGAHCVVACAKTPYFSGVKRTVDKLWISRLRWSKGGHTVRHETVEKRPVPAIAVDMFVWFDTTEETQRVTAVSARRAS